MKTKWNFTKGEYVAGLTLLAIVISSYLFYYLYDSTAEPSLGKEAKEQEFLAFAAEQERLRDSIDLARTMRYPYHRTYYSSDSLPKDSVRKKRRMYDIVKLDINRCDTDDIKVIPKFGSKRAAALISYRDKLGGFYALSQLKEVFVLQSLEEDFLQTYFVVHASAVKKINVNTASYQEMMNHPYFDAYLSKTIIHYRQKNGNITSMEELQRVTHAYPELMEKLSHYVVFQ